MKYIKKIGKRLLVLLAVGYFCLPLLLLYLASGIYDVIRQKTRPLLPVARQYFLGNGALTWLFSPLNLFIDLITLPYINKQVYQLKDLPKAHQEEIKQLIEECPKEHLIETIHTQDHTHSRSMTLYKWYGINVKNKKPCPLFHRKFKYILTIGISKFNSQMQTSKHFGWLRAGIRVLYNIDPILQEGAYIIANQTPHIWKQDGRLFIFDDTVLHQSFNLTDMPRHCLFIDIARPCLFPGLIRYFVQCLGLMSLYTPGFSRLSRWNIEK